MTRAEEKSTLRQTLEVIGLILGIIVALLAIFGPLLVVHGRLLLVENEVGRLRQDIDKCENRQQEWLEKVTRLDLEMDIIKKDLERLVYPVETEYARGEITPPAVDLSEAKEN